MTKNTDNVYVYAKKAFFRFLVNAEKREREMFDLMMSSGCLTLERVPLVCQHMKIRGQGL